MSFRSTVALLAAVATLAAGCGSSGTDRGQAISPQPIPEPGKHVRFEPSKLGLSAIGDSTEIRGSMTWGPGTVWAFDLDARTRADAPVAADGSFVVRVLGRPFHAFRLAGWHDGYLAEPLDVTAGSSGAIREIPLGVCLASAETQVSATPVAPGATSSVNVTLSNECDRELVMDLAWVSGSAFRVGGARQWRVAPRGQQVVDVTFAPERSGVHVELIVVEAAGTRLPITVQGIVAD